MNVLRPNMVEVAERSIVEGLGAERITVKNVQYWCKHTKQLRKPQTVKAQRFVEFDCIKYLGDDDEFKSKYTFVCLPLNPSDHYVLEINGVKKVFGKISFPVHYNSSDYKIFKNEYGAFECNCQGWQTRAKRGEVGLDGCSCSHVLALFFCFKLGLFKRGS